jgi:probable LLM family oxidoreductase
VDLGLYSFGDIGPDPETGRPPTPEQRVKQLIEEIELADQVGLDWFGVGEHHRPDYVVSSYATVLAAAAARTSRIRLSSAVSVLSSDEPVRVYQNHATLDLISGGRAEIMAGRGAYYESFKLFGYNTDDYDELFAEKFDLLLKLCRDEQVTWSGNHGPSLEDVTVHPRPVQHPLPLWIAIGGNPNSIRRAGKLGIPVAIAAIGRAPENFVPMVQLYRESGEQAGQDPAALQLSITCHYHVGETPERAASEFWPAYTVFDHKIAPERGFPPMNYRMFENSMKKRSWLAVGSPEQVTEKILFQHEVLGNDRWIGCSSMGGLPHRDVMSSIELFGTQVAPAVREEVARRNLTASPPLALASV